MNSKCHQRKFRVKRFAAGKWHIICPGGIPLYDDAPDGQDKPLVFTDQDLAVELAQTLNQNTNPT